MDEVEGASGSAAVSVRWDQWLRQLITVKWCVYTPATSVMSLERFGQLGVSVFRIDNQVWIVVTLFAGTLFTLKILADLH